MARCFGAAGVATGLINVHLLAWDPRSASEQKVLDKPASAFPD
jgi:hypothetical protein